MDTIRRRHLPTPLNIIIVDLVAVLPAAELPRLRCINTLWRMAIDLELARRIGFTVLDTAGYSIESIEFWIRAGMGNELVQNIPQASMAKVLPYCAAIPALLKIVIYLMKVEMASPFDWKNLCMAAVQLIRDRPLVALSHSCSQIWRSFARIGYNNYSSFEFSATWGQMYNSNLVNEHQLFYYSYKAFSSKRTAAIPLTYRDVRTIALYRLSQGHCVFAERMLEVNLLTMNSALATQIINVAVCAIVSDVHPATFDNFIDRHCIGFYDPALDGGHARSVVDGNPLVDTPLMRRAVGLD